MPGLVSREGIINWLSIWRHQNLVNRKLVKKPRPRQTSRRRAMLADHGWLLYCCCLYGGGGFAAYVWDRLLFLSLDHSLSTDGQNKGHVHDRDFVLVPGHGGQVVR